MYFVDRVSLGKTLAGNLEQFRGKDAVVLCLKEDSLLMSLTLAMKLRAWVYPLAFTPIYSQDQSHNLIGAVDAEGTFCARANDELSFFNDQVEVSEGSSDVMNQKQSAAIAAKQQLSQYGITFDRRILNNRDVIIAGDIITDPLPVLVAQQMLKTINPKSLNGVIGNATPSVVDIMRVTVDTLTILDVLSGVIFDDNHYFEHQDAYTVEQKHTLTHHIATYWE